MKRFKKNAVIAALALCLCGNAMAGNEVILTAPADHHVLAVSANGKWACGYYLDYGYTTHAFRWNLESGTVELLGNPNNESIAWDVSNDGTVSGEFGDTEMGGNSAVTMPGFFKDGQWHHLEAPQGAVGGIGGYITPDGKHLCGTLYDRSEQYTSYIWSVEDGKLQRTLSKNGNSNAVYAISPDGKSAAGWDYGLTGNRTACYWGEDGTLTYFDDGREGSYTGPFCYVRNFSPDGKKLVYVGGDEVSEDETSWYLYAIYDLETKERQKIRIGDPAANASVEFFDISNNGTVAGMVDNVAHLYHNGELVTVEKYLTDKGVSLSSFKNFWSESYNGGLPLQKAVSISADDNVIALWYYDKNGYTTSMVVKVNQDKTNWAPVELQGRQLPGTNTVALTWKRPQDVYASKGYNIYRDGTKINGSLPVNNAYYYDSKATLGEHTYTVKSITNNGENASETITVTLAENTPSAPMALYTRQKGLNDVYLSWAEPMSNGCNLEYCDYNSKNIDGIFTYETTDMEAAVKFDSHEMANFSGGKISEVSFYPLGVHNGWKVNIYDHSMNKLYTQDVPTVKVNQRNVVKLSTPLDVTATGIIVALETTTTPNTKILGSEYSNVKPGYSDLLRQPGTDSEFYSMLERGISNGMAAWISWCIGIGIEPKGYSKEDNTLEKYIVTLDGTQAAETQSTECVLNSVAEGQHTIGVQAVYASSDQSEAATASINLKTGYKGVTDVEVTTDGSKVTAKWKAPVNDDETSVSYTAQSSSSKGMRGPDENGGALQIAAIYTPATLKGYNGYNIRSLRFYPMCEALYGFYLYENDTMVSSVEIDYEDATPGQWNTIQLPDQITLNEDSEYKLVIDAYDPDPDSNIFGVDSYMPLDYFSNLYSTDDGETWKSLSSDADVIGNWMMGLDITAPESQPMPITGYDVRMDNFKKNTDKLTSTEFTFDYGKTDTSSHTLRVDAYYEAKTASVKGSDVTFYLSTTGISDNMIADITLRQGDNQLQVQGDGVESVTIYSADGQTAAAADGSTVSLNSLASGTYIVKAIVNGKKAVTRKISVTR